MKNTKGFTLLELLIILVVGAILVLGIGFGWVRNIVKLSNLDFEPPYKTEVIRIVGLVPPVGMVTGWMTIGEENDMVITIPEELD